MSFMNLDNGTPKQLAASRYLKNVTTPTSDEFPQMFPPRLLITQGQSRNENVKPRGISLPL